MESSFFLPVLFKAVAVVVAVPAEEADIDEACTDGYPGGAGQPRFFVQFPFLSYKSWLMFFL